MKDFETIYTFIVPSDGITRPLNNTFDYLNLNGKIIHCFEQKGIIEFTLKSVSVTVIDSEKLLVVVIANELKYKE